LIATDIELTNTLTEAAAPAPQPLPEPTPSTQPVAATAPINGPTQGPTASLPLDDDEPVNDAPPGSPYTSNRAMIQNLTLPTVPNFDIPPSPPGSPPQQATKKFANFLKLKRKEGVHFNQRLEDSSVLKDPGHLQRQLDFAGISEEEQYESTLPEAIAVPVVFPEWAYFEELKASQKQIFKAREQQKSKAPRETVDFVSATKSETPSGVGTPSGKGPRDRPDHVASHMAGKRKELEHRSRDNSQSKNRWRSRSRSPKRRRSKSRDRR
jgi:hypothetical protein